MNRVQLLAALAAVYLWIRTQGGSANGSPAQVATATQECKPFGGLASARYASAPGGVNYARCRDGTEIRWNN